MERRKKYAAAGNLLVQAAAETDRGDYAMAEKKYSKAMASVPDNPAALFASAYFYHWKLIDSDRALDL